MSCSSRRGKARGRHGRLADPDNEFTHFIREYIDEQRKNVPDHTHCSTDVEARSVLVRSLSKCSVLLVLVLPALIFVLHVLVCLCLAGSLLYAELLLCSGATYQEQAHALPARDVVVGAVVGTISVYFLLVLAGII